MYWPDLSVPMLRSNGSQCWLGLEFRYFFARKTMFVKYAQAFVIIEALPL